MFISAAAGENTRTLKAVVRELGRLASDVEPVAGTPYSVAVIDAIGAADLVVVVLPSRDSGASPLVEAGAALALDKPILLIAPSTDRAVPSDLQHLQIIQASLENQAALRTALSRALGRPTAVVRNVADTTRSLGAQSRPLPSCGEGTGRAARRGTILSYRPRGTQCSWAPTGVQARVGFRAAPDRAYFAGWADTLDDLLGNPFVTSSRSDSRASDPGEPSPRSPLRGFRQSCCSSARRNTPILEHSMVLAVARY